MQRLTQQMQPHFLFNALNTVSSLMHTDVARADATLMRLADVLRRTLDVSELHEATPLCTAALAVRARRRGAPGNARRGCPRTLETNRTQKSRTRDIGYGFFVSSAEAVSSGTC
ncbi:histidine kinase [Massilia sp. TWR1-2-2]|uniref:histidine kinase n=1 Tax=Massilia sp. TWR1-2-2 TaxID=2804584 RepID=UPI003CF6A77D